MRIPRIAWAYSDAAAVFAVLGAATRVMESPVRWEASRRLPAELLEALPAPPPQDVAIERQPA
jgi:hypothetical protein